MDNHMEKIEKTETVGVPGKGDDVLRWPRKQSLSSHNPLDRPLSSGSDTTVRPLSSRTDTTEDHSDTVLREGHEKDRIDVTARRYIDGIGYPAMHRYKLEGRFLDLVKDGRTDEQYYRSRSLSDQRLDELKEAAKSPQQTRVHQLKYGDKLYFINIGQMDKTSMPDGKGNRAITYTETTFRAKDTFYAGELYGDK